MLNAAKFRVETLETHLRKHYFKVLKPRRPSTDYEDLLLAIEVLEKIRILLDHPFWAEVEEGSLFHACWANFMELYQVQWYETIRNTDALAVFQKVATETTPSRYRPKDRQKPLCD